MPHSVIVIEGIHIQDQGFDFEGAFLFLISTMVRALASTRYEHQSVERLLGNFFSLAEQIGEGGMGMCYKCVDSSGATKVVKMSKDPAADTLEDEFKMLDKLRHPHIAKVYRFIAIGDARGYEMDIMANGDLHATIVRRGHRPGRFTHFELADWLHGILSGLSYMHAVHIMHRDIKPANILFDHGWRAILGDLGLAVHVALICYRAPHTCCGTLGFIAPEVVAQEEYGTPADVWSVNRVLHTCLTGDPSGHTLCNIHNDVHLLQITWIYVLIRRSGCFVPSERARAEQLCKLIDAPGDIDAGAPPSDVNGISQDIRADGKGALLRKGRVAERHIKRNKRADVIDVKAEKVHSGNRNAYRKIRRKAGLAKRKHGIPLRPGVSL